MLDEIATLNAQVANATVTNRSTADAEDKRDTDINELSGLIDISFFKRSDNVVVVQTKQGEELASETARHLSFSPTPLGPTTAYPATVAGLYLGNPVTDPASVDLTTKDLGGKIGGLLELRDQIFPKEMAQTDELAHQLATRTAEQGLALFTDSSGNIPPDTAPNPTTSPPTPVPYVGFSAKIQVNPAILNDHTLLQKGTYGATLPTGSNQVIRRVIQFAFGDVDYQQAIGDIDIRVSTQGPPTTLQNFLGLHSTNEVDGVTDLSSFPDPATLIATTNGAIGPGKDTFRLTFQDSNLGLGPVNIDVPVGSIPNTGGDFTQDLISYINGTVIPALPAPQQAALTAMNVSFSESSTGQFVTKSNATITVDATNPPNAMGAAGLAFLGLAPGVTKATDPYFDVRVGNNASTRITIDSNDTEVDLQAKLATVPGLAMQDLVTSPDGFLRIRPGDIYTNPNFGGDITISSGPGTTLGATANVIVAPGTVPNGLNIVSALFGSFSTGPTQDLTPVKDVGYGSQTNASLTPPIPTLPFRTTLLGPSANISTNIPGADNLVDYAQQLVNEQTQQANDTKSQLTDATSLQSLLQDQLSGESGVNLDQEFGNLITVQNAYAASARVISTVSQMFTLLLNAVNA